MGRTRTPISQGICAFCHTECAKTTITQHLKACSQRQSILAAQEQQAPTTKTRLLHLLAEGEYAPHYWLHFELAASEPLYTVDNFLKALWIADLDHLSSFTINDTPYRTDEPDAFFFFQQKQHEHPAEEEQAQTLHTLLDTTLAPFISKAAFLATTPLGASPLSEVWLATLKHPRSLDAFVGFLKGELARIITAEQAKDTNDQECSPYVQHLMILTLDYQKLIVKQLLEAVEDRSMAVSLARVLTVGQTFSYTYDFGSSTSIRLKVLAEREGILPYKQPAVQLLARNSPLALSCHLCGQPATLVATGFFPDTLAERVYCTSCATMHCEEHLMLPLLNSPRVGIV